MKVVVTRSLAHHGIKGQRHGVRRFQNEDGTLTDEGRRRYGLQTRKDANGKEYTATVKSIYDMSDSEYDLYKIRMDRYNENHSMYIKSGQVKTRELLQTTGAVLSVALTANKLIGALKPNTNNKKG